MHSASSNSSSFAGDALLLNLADRRVGGVGSGFGGLRPFHHGFRASLSRMFFSHSSRTGRAFLPYPGWGFSLGASSISASPASVPAVGSKYPRGRTDAPSGIPCPGAVTRHRGGLKLRSKYRWGVQTLLGFTLFGLAAGWAVTAPGYPTAGG